MRIWAVSDMHTDYKDNLEWLRALVRTGPHGGSSDGGGGGNGALGGPYEGPFDHDVLLIAGDVSDALTTLETTLQLCASAFGHVFFVPGNHDLWVRRHERGQYDSLGKLEAVHALCARLGVHTTPACINGVWIFPLLSWYSGQWDREPDVPGSTPIDKVMIDFHACQWPNGLNSADDSLADYFDALNEPAFSKALQGIEEETDAAGGKRPPIISFSHFLPRQELLPEKRMLYYPNLAKASGSDALEARVRRLRPLAHVFGHTHFSWDAQVDGIRYVQWPLGYPHEHRRRRGGGAGWEPLPLFDTDKGLAAHRDCYWSSYYVSNRRNPLNVQPAPWGYAAANPKTPRCSACPSGTMAATPGYRTCTACPVGSATGLTPTENGGSGATAVAASKCELYPARTFRQTAFTASNQPCPPGWTLRNPSDVVCAVFSPGTFTANPASTGGVCPCPTCPAGSYSSDKGSATCALCEPVQYRYQPSQGSTACSSCHSGTANDKNGGAALSACGPCSKGTYAAAVPLGHRWAATPATPARRATTLMPPVRLPACPAPPALPARPAAPAVPSWVLCCRSSARSGACLPSTAGTYNSKPNQAVCLARPAGSYCPGAAQTKVTACPAGTFRALPGATTTADCSACAINTIAAVPGAKTCNKCAANAWTGRLAGQSSCWPLNQKLPATGRALLTLAEV
ncbi:Metallo-dependent [Micractinium conductrix]|uniref:Metallo-dependent n=1 Tax=Micractinium conductrix TaxID=554055 RepID=A0A2P6VRE3_9CHLO|nr:Metallo-dependent [Micractinium conductrix]|eukprot:PSC76652.1 Metallo-dependent [Micractinium conductrix]